jgi:hypothetical protein
MFKSTDSAAIGLVTSGPLAALSWVDQVDIIIRWGAGAAAFVSAVMAARYYYNANKKNK